ncbi:MAG TPA: DUF899 domain-containing protein [Xanthobacteraceae bacterium]|nr:DUF899 domain-containing protein [Xanthobacteraceae bacterium]
MPTHQVVSRDEWLAARVKLLAEEKEFTRRRDALTRHCRELPWVRIEDYVFESPNGKVRLSDLFRGKSQLIVYHFMFHPDWNAGCKSCSYWADNYERIVVHLRARDTNLVAVSRAPLAKIEAFRKRMGWTFEWVSCGADGVFNHDFGAYLTKADLAKEGNNTNYGTRRFTIEDVPAISVFFKDGDGVLYHTYSTYSRGLDIFNGAYHYLDIVPKGRDEEKLKYHMDWVRLRDEYS